MNLRDNLIAPCAIASDTNPDLLEVDLDAFVTRLLLFDDYILQSIRLLEFPVLIKALGFGTVLDLLSAKLIKVNCDIATFAQVGHLSNFASRHNKPPLPLGSYFFATVRGANREHNLHLLFQNLEKQLPLALKDIIKLKRMILTCTIKTPHGFGDDTLNQTNAELRSGKTDLIKRLLSKALLKLQKLNIDPSQLQVRLHPLDGTDLKVETNLNTFGLDAQAEHKAVESALLAAFGLNQRLEEMKTYNALSGCMEDDSPLFMDKLGFLLAEASPQRRAEQFQRVVEIAGIPEFLPRLDVLNVDRLVRVRSSSEIVEFRSWLHGASKLTDRQIKDLVKSIRDKMGYATTSGPGKVIRFVATVGIGLGGVLPGVIAGAIDSFLIEKILPKSGVWSFVNRLYPSIFERDVSKT